MKIVHIIILTAISMMLGACSAKDNAQTKPSAQVGDLSIPFEKFTLANGLDVVFHIDRSDPIVAIDLAVHVGSARETPGRTGFAHLFEHLLFMDSENLGYGGLDEMNTRIGGEGTNGFTTHDMTQYFQAVPKDALEKVIWAEADKLGYFINTVTQNIIDNEKQVVKNEKRLRVDNQPYGHNFYIINKALYPQDHPYNWQVIGSLADLDAASLDDVHAFYKRWYGPGNVTLTLTGDFDRAQAKAWVEKYFGEIPKGEDIPPLRPRAATLTADKKLYHEDAFAKTPQLTLVWPAVEQYHPDSYALDILMQFLSDGKRAPLNAVLIDEAKLTSQISAFQYVKELADEIYIFITANDGQDLDAMLPALETAFKRFEDGGISQADLDRIKAGLEVDFYDNIQSDLGKAIQLGESNLFTGDAGQISKTLTAMQAVSRADVMRVYKTYIQSKPAVYTSFVPKGALGLILEGSVKAEVVEEKIVAGEGAPVDFDPAARVIENPAPSSFDRSIEPPFGPPYALPSPKVWQSKLANGVELYGLKSDEVPLVYFSLYIDAGANRLDVSKPAIPALTAQMLQKGTKGKTTAELEDAIKSLGSSISISDSWYGAFASGSTLSRNFDPTIALLQEILLEPRWDSEEFELLKSKMASEIDQTDASTSSIANRELAKLRYPPTHPFSVRYIGSKAQLETVTLEDVKAFYAQNYTQNGAKIRIVGAVDKSQATKALSTLGKSWDKPAPPVISLPQEAAVETPSVYFYDVPGAKQSVLRVQRPALSAKDQDYPQAIAINFLLGGTYTSKLNTELRVNKGYTYGVRSSFSGQIDRGSFDISSSVRSNVTLESLEIIHDIVSSYGPDFTQEDLSVMKDALLRGEALKNETLNDKLSMVSQMASYGYPASYRAENAARINAMTLDEFKALAAKYLTPDAMRYLVVGDAKTQASRLSELGYGEVQMLNGDTP